MADIFISYSSKDRKKVSVLARELAKTGWSVWWDPVIEPGKVYDVVIEEQVEAARGILVCWTTSSINSSWVRAEAGDGLNRGILIPVLLEPVDIPLVFRQVNAANLVDWSGDPDDENFHRLVASLAARLGDPPNQSVPVIKDAAHMPGSIEPQGSSSAAGRASKPSSSINGKLPGKQVLAGLAIAALVGAGVWAAVGWREAATQRAETELNANQKAAGLALKLPRLAGKWETDYGIATLKQRVDQIEGTILYNNGNSGEFRGLLKPHVSGKYYVLDYNWKNGADFGDGILNIPPGNQGTLRGYWVDQAGTRGKWVWTKAGK